MGLIDADALMKYPIRLNHYDKDNGNEDFVLGIESVLEYAENLPTIEAEPVKSGRWETESIALVPDENGKFRGESLYTCSECGWGCSCESELGFRFCPNCGARMDGGKINDD